MFNGEKTAQISRKQMSIHVSRLADIYRTAYDLQSADIIDRVTKLAFSMIKRLAVQKSKRRGELTPNDWGIRTLPPFDSSNMEHLDTHKRLMYTMFKAAIFDTNLEVKISDETTRFFADKRLVKHEPSDVSVAIDNICTGTFSNRVKVSDKQLQPSMRAALQSYAKSLKPSLSIDDINAIVDSIDVDDSTKLFVNLHAKMQES
jgi:hypothetical protein